MLTRQDLMKDMRSQNKGASLLSKEAIGSYFGIGKGAVQTYTHELEHIKVGTKKLYHVSVLAKRYEEMRRVS